MADDHNITVYSTPTCPYCRQAKQYFTDKGVTFTDRDVTVDQQARDEMVKKSGQLGVPVIEIDGNLIIGFNRTKIEKLLT